MTPIKNRDFTNITTVHIWFHAALDNYIQHKMLIYLINQN